MFKRKIYDKLISWKKESEGKTALLIEGPRRVGKSTLVENFAKNEYESYIVSIEKTRQTMTDEIKAIASGFQEN